MHHGAFASDIPKFLLRQFFLNPKSIRGAGPIAPYGPEAAFQNLKYDNIP
ncbi:hypothetical protein D1AOALGA4SA_12850 [Olavius algarvensis Delta 1 endosymbiont]|nr:hypothetical protein D1AOALGA4SA_12850 [Olavius algarvensis Delta 1 endosymbiont]